MRKWTMPLLFAAAGAAVSLFVYDDLPERIAVHFGTSGEPDDWMARPIAAFLAPALTIALTALLFGRAKAERDENKRLRAEASIGAVAAIMAAMLFAVHVFTIRYNLGYTMNPSLFASFVAGAVFILIGNLVPRLGQQGRQWPRVPEAAQGRLGRLQGRLMMAFGLLFLLTSLLPAAYLTPAFFLCLVLYLGALFGCLFYYSRRFS